MPTATKITTEPRTVSGTGFWRRNDVANNANPATAKIAPPTRLYCRCAAAERDQSPDGVASVITHSLITDFVHFPLGNRQLSAKKSNHDFGVLKNQRDQTKPVSPASPAMP